MSKIYDGIHVCVICSIVAESLRWLLYRDQKRAKKTRSHAVARTADRTAADCLVISDCCQMASPTVFEILGHKDIGVMTLIFQGHMTS